MWINKGLLLDIQKYVNDHICSHASIPFAFNLRDNYFRIFFSSRNSSGKSLPFYVDTEIKNGEINIIDTIKGPLLNLGNPGTFDDSGIMSSSFVEHNNDLYMYYIGWNEEVLVPYKLSIGLAISKDGGNTFTKYSQGPIMDRSITEPYFNTAPYVIKEKSKWKMWYISCSEWIIYDNKKEPVYTVKYTESKDGVNWVKKNITSIKYSDKIECVGRPCILKKKNKYEIYFSNRKSINYRKDKLSSYKISKSVSKNGKYWNDNFEIDILPYGQLWDDKMREYCHVFIHENITYMIYNGNDFGKKGFGYSINKEN